MKICLNPKEVQLYCLRYETDSVIVLWPMKLIEFLFSEMHDIRLAIVLKLFLVRLKMNINQKGRRLEQLVKHMSNGLHKWLLD